MDETELEFFKSHGIIYNKTIGHGSFGKIYLVFSTHYQQYFALKKIQERLFNQVEIECLKTIDNVNVINLYDYYRINGFVYMLMEYCPNDLSRLIKANKHIDDAHMPKYCHEILMAIKACHDLSIAHSDIKPSNLLIDSYGRVKVCDFGLSSYHADESSNSDYKGTMLFLAPEAFRGQAYNLMKADVWALGATFYYMATGNYPFMATSYLSYVRLVNNGDFASEKVTDIYLRDVIERCLVVDPDLRASVDDLLTLPYFARFYSPSASLMKKVQRRSQSQVQKIIKPITVKLMKQKSQKNHMFAYGMKNSRI